MSMERKSENQMHIGVDTAVFCNDTYCGVNRHLLIHPHPLRLTHLIVMIHHCERLVPVSMINTVLDTGIHLKYNLNQLSTLDSFVKTNFIEVTLPDYGFAEYSYTSPQTGMSVPIASYNIPPGEYVLSRQTQVEAKNGHIGQFKELIIDPATYQISHLIFQQGHLWERKYVTIPISFVERLEGDTIYLNINKADV